MTGGYQIPQWLSDGLRKAGLFAGTGRLDELRVAVRDVLSRVEQWPDGRQSALHTALETLSGATTPREAWSQLAEIRALLEGQTTTLPEPLPDRVPDPTPSKKQPEPRQDEGQDVDGEQPLNWTPPELPEALLDEFFSEVGEYLDEVTQLVLSPLLPGSDDVHELYRKLHTVKGNSGMVGLGPLQRLVHRLEDLVKTLRDENREPTEAQRQFLAEGAELAVRILDAASSGSIEVIPVNAFLKKLTGETPAPEPLPVPPSTTALSSPTPTPSALASSSSKPPSGTRGRMLRVDFGQVDRLASMVGEQAVKQEEVQRQVERLQESLETFALQLERSFSQTEANRDSLQQYLRSSARNLSMLATNLEGTTQELDFVSADLQNAVLDLRLVPLESLFKKHEMTVYRTSTKLGKKARLEVDAGGARLDKSIVEKLEEPLIHLIRNAVGHGLESEDERRNLGKNPEGTVLVRAIPQGNQVVIRVEDDGRGLDPETISHKAVEKGFLSEEEAGRTEASRLIDLIFAPGFSTTAVADDVSGRGVGLDVVREKINRLNGAVEVLSEPEKGTAFQLTLPLTLALAKVLLVEVAGETTAIPADSVGSIVTIEGTSLARVEGVHMARIHGEAVPLVFLDSALGLSHVRRFQQQVTALLVNHAGRQVAFVVDKVLEHIQAVIRDVGAALPDIRGAMGVTFHEGRCVLIVDVGTVIRERIELRKARHRAERRTVFIVTDRPDHFRKLHRYTLEKESSAVLIHPEALSDWGRPLPRVLLDAVDGKVSRKVETVRQSLHNTEIALLAPEKGLDGQHLDELYACGVVAVEKWPVSCPRLYSMGKLAEEGETT